MKTHPPTILALVLLLAACAGAGTTFAATEAFHTASADPGLNPDADGNTAQVWTVEKSGPAGTGTKDSPGDRTKLWTIWTSSPEGSITQTHVFAGGALTPGQTVSLDYAHNTNIAPGKRVGLRLLGAGGAPEVEFSFLGGTNGVGFLRKDASTTGKGDQGDGYVPSGKEYDATHVFHVSFTITGPGAYSASADGAVWRGAFAHPITGIQVFNAGGGNQSDQMSNNLVVESPGLPDVKVAPSRQGPPPPPAFMDTKEIDDRAAALLQQMTLEEKLGQLTQFSGGMATGPDNVKLDQNELAARGGLGSILNLTGAKEVNELQRQAVEKSRLKIPILFSLDVIHGYRTIYPVPLALAASWDAKIAEDCARVAAVEATSEGIRWTFSPMVDIARDARWGRIVEGNGEDTYLGGVLAAAWVRGYQGKTLSDPTSMLACAKHYVAYGGTEGGREYNLVDISDRVLEDVYLPPFKAAVDAGVGTFMSAFNTVGGVPTTANHHTLTDILRTRWGFRGFVVSDWNSIGELIAHGIALDGSAAALKALTAGVDMDMTSNLYATKGAALLQSGQLKMATVDEAVTRVLRLKLALGLFEHPYTDENLSASVLLKPAHLAVARTAAEASFVLLKNDGVNGKPLLPLSPDKTVALIGHLANSPTDMMGTWNAKGRPAEHTTLKDALAERLHDRLIYAEGAGPASDDESGFGEALAAAGRADIVVMALGETGVMTGEATARSRLDLPGKQSKLLQAVVATGKPVVLVLFNGRPLALPWEAEHVPAILEAWFPGVQAGPALARTLFGDVNPAGRLTVSFPRSVGQMPIYYNTLNTGRPALGKSPGSDFITGYHDELNTPLFPFGWGLSYTTFRYAPTRISTGKISAAELNADGKISVEATVKNTGSRTGSETVQLYIQLRGTSVARPIRELKGFEKIELAPGESRLVRFELTKKELAFWNLDMKNTVEPCELRAWVAPHAQGGTLARMIIDP